MGLLDLAAAIEGLRAGLTQAMDAGAGEGVHFDVESIELTVQAVLTDEGHGRVGWKVLDVGGSREVANTQSLRLSLVPVWVSRSDGSVKRHPLIAGQVPGGPPTIPGTPLAGSGVAGPGAGRGVGGSFGDDEPDPEDDA